MKRLNIFALCVLLSSIFIGCAQNSSDVGRNTPPPPQGELTENEIQVVRGFSDLTIVEVSAKLLELAAARRCSITAEAELIDNNFTIRCSQNGCQAERKNK